MDELRARLKARMEPGFSDVSYPEGWTRIVSDLDGQLARIYADYRIGQVKEKFGGLRYYVGPIPTEVSESFFAAIDRATDRSFQTCQSCGKTGQLQTIGSWYYTLCPEHEDATRKWRKKQWEKTDGTN